MSLILQPYRSSSRTDLPDVRPMDPAVSFIARNALNDLAYFTFEREPQFLERSSGSESIAVSVIDFDRRRRSTLDTRSCSGPNANSSKTDEMLRILFSPVPNSTVQCRAVFRQAKNCLSIDRLKRPYVELCRSHLANL